MKIRVLPQEMARQIALVQKAISNRTNMKILEFIHFEAQGDHVTLMATDLELTIVASMEAQVEEEGEVVLPANMAGNIFRKLPPVEATLTASDQQVKIVCGASHFELQVPSAREFPDPPKVEEGQETQISNQELSLAVSETEFAASLDESRLALTGIYFERQEDYVRLVTIDGYRLAIRQIALSPDSDRFIADAVVPRRAFTEWVRSIKGEGMTVISQVPGHILFQSENLQLYSRLIDKQYIRYEDIISKEFSNQVTLDRLDFLQALERASLLSQEERANLIKLRFVGDRLHIASNTELGQVHEELAIEMSGEEMPIAFNAKYLLDGVRCLSCERLSLELNGSLNPLVMRPADGEEDYFYLVLPVRVAGGR